MKKKTPPLVGIIMGSDSDFPTMKRAIEILKQFKIPHEVEVVSAHRTPQRMYEYSESAHKRGLQVIIAGAGGSAHLPGMVASLTSLPVIGVPVETKTLQGLDSLLSIVQMPPGIPVATMSIGNSANAALFATRILALTNKEIAGALEKFQEQQIAKVKKMNSRLKKA